MGKFRIVYTGWKMIEIEAVDAADAENKFWREHYSECEVRNANFAYADDITNVSIFTTNQAMKLNGYVSVAILLAFMQSTRAITRLNRPKRTGRPTSMYVVIAAR